MDRREFIRSAQVVFSMYDATKVIADAENLVIDLRETPGACHGHGSSRAFEVVHLMKKQWNQEVAVRTKTEKLKDDRGIIRGSLRIDRNAPCACGSGRKSKKCCGGGR